MITYKVLAVDDEAALRRGVARILRDFRVDVSGFDESIRFDITEASTGEEAVEYFESNEADLMILDLGLPGIQGMDVLQRITADGRDVIVIIATAYASIETAVSTTKQGAFDFLAKPFTPEELRNTVAKAVQHLFTVRHARKLDQERSQQRFQLISIVSHELKSPLGVVESYLKVLADPGIEKSPEMYDRIVSRSMKRLEGMRKLILDLLDLTRIESGLKKRDIAAFDLTDNARRSAEAVAPDAQSRGISVKLDIPERLDFVGDSGELDIILNNLMTNAVKYNREGGSVRLSMAEADGVVTIRVADTGIGMTKEESAKLFQEFLRIKNSKTTNIPGSGLGLSIVRRLARLYGGDAVVDSEPDVGTEFTVTVKRQQLPAAPEPAAAP